MELNLTGQTAVVVGGARGIGRAIALAFAAEGSNVAVIDRDPEGEAVAKEIEGQRRVRALALVGDVTDYGAMRRAAGKVEASFGRTDHVVYAVAVGSGKYGFPFWNLEPGDWGRVLAVNVIGAVNVAHAFTPALVRAR